MATRVADPVRLGIIGFGVRGTEIAKTLIPGTAARIVAVADLYSGRRARATELLGAGTFATADYRHVLSRRDVDAVVIATPDHSHLAIALDALQAGKDVYCEAPVIHVAQDAKALQPATKNRIFQVGSAIASAAPYARAREVIASGKLGRVTMVRATWDTVSALDAWQRPFPPDASPDTIDFTGFLGATAKRPFDLHRFFRWPCYWDYGSGLAGARVVPLLTAIQLTLGSKAPARATLSGGTWRWKDGREVPDTLIGSFDYDEGFTASLSATQNGGGGRAVQFVGTDASLLVTDTSMTVRAASQTEPYMTLGETWPKEYRDWFYMMHGLSPQGAPRREFPAPAGDEAVHVAQDSSGLATHLADFVRSVQTREEPKESLSIGLQAAEAAATATTALRQRARLVRR